VAGGFGSAVLELLPITISSGSPSSAWGSPTIFVEHGTQGVLRKKYELDAAGILKHALAILSQAAEPKKVVWGTFN